jgi:hypothetical protein
MVPALTLACIGRAELVHIRRNEIANILVHWSMGRKLKRHLLKNTV